MDYGWLSDGAGRSTGSPAPRRRSRRRPLATISATLLLVAACGGQPAASPSTLASTAASATAEATPTPEPTATPTPTPTPQASATTAAGECQPQARTTLSQGWKELTGQDGDYRFSSPADWTNLGTAITLPTNVSVSPETFAQTGAGSSAKINVDVVRSADNTTQISAWALKGVTSPTTELFGNELAWLKTQPQLKAVVDDTLTACIDGTPASGFSSTWTYPDGDRTFVIYMAQRSGRMYEIQLTAFDPSQSSTLDEFLRTWKFTSPATGTPGNVDDQLAATKFKMIATSDTLDESGDHPNPATFKTVFPQATARIYVLYELDDGIHDTVDFVWKRNGSQVATATFPYGDKTSFAWTWMNKNSTTGKFAAGNYEVTATLKALGDTISIAFTVE